MAAEEAVDVNIKILVAMHKAAPVPKDDLYLPMQAGKCGKPALGYQGDDVGDNISAKNPDYCELTALYWAWKNLQADYIGLVHYRRYFCGSGIDGEKQFAKIANAKDIERLLGEADIIVPKKRHYYVESIYSHYAHAHRKSDLDLVGAIIKEKYPKYLPAFENLKKRKSAHMFNMLIMRRDILHEYCQWLFGVLFELEKRIGNNHEPRVFGFLSERLLDVWLETNNLQYVEQSLVNFGVENIFVKGIKMLGRKIRS